MLHWKYYFLPLFTRHILAQSLITRALNPQCAPGGNFDLSHWSLQLPTSANGKDIDTVSTSQLVGCSGFQDKNHKLFFTESGDGALVMKVDSSNPNTCFTTPNSQHCRTELREQNPSSWSPNAGVNRLAVTLAVEQVDNGSHGTVIGQIHIDDSISSKPVCELYYSPSGDIVMGVQRERDQSGQNFSTIGNVPVGTVFSYEIRYESNRLTISLNGGSATTLSTNNLNAPKSYFKVGNYNQGTIPSDVHFFAIVVSH